MVLDYGHEYVPVTFPIHFVAILNFISLYIYAVHFGVESKLKSMQTVFL
jgi:hypothetical protein